MSGRNVIWITLESLRLDRTTLGGHVRSTTPNLQRLSNREDGVNFDQCFSHDIWTRSSSASILTGYAPSAHQTWSNGARLPDKIPTIPEAFQADGYRTVCISPNPQLSTSTGLDRGFDYFHYIERSTILSEVGLSSLAKWAVNISHHGGGLTLERRKHCRGYLLNEVAKKHISSASKHDDSLFLYIHHGDSHHPYIPPKSWADHFTDRLSIDSDQAFELAFDMSDNLHQYIGESRPFTDEEWEALEVMYDTVVRYVDHLVGKLVKYAENQLKNPIVVVTGDHGELFGEYGLLAHMLVTHTAVSNVPLVISGIDGLPTSGLVQHADIMRMLCDELGLEHPVPAGKDIRDEPREVAVTQRGGERARNKLNEITKNNPEYDTSQFHPKDLSSIRTTEWRYQTAGERSELFDLDDEMTDVSDDYPNKASQLDKRLTTWLESVGQPIGRTGTAEFTDQMEDRLRDLGYLQ